MQLHMNSQHVIIDSANTATLTSLASTQIPSPPPSPNSVGVDELDDPNSSLIESSFRNDVRRKFLF